MAANWFIALPVRAGPWLDVLAPPPGVRLFAPSDLHLTVAFLGAVSADDARDAFAEAAHFPLARQHVRLSQITPLGGRARPSAFSAQLAEGRIEVERAMGAARAAMYERAGARADLRPPLAHVTLARPQRRATPEQVDAAVRWALAIDLGGPLVELDRLALYTWSEDRARALFRVDREHTLAADPP